MIKCKPAQIGALMRVAPLVLAYGGAWCCPVPQAKGNMLLSTVVIQGVPFLPCCMTLYVIYVMHIFAAEVSKGVGK